MIILDPYDDDEGTVPSPSILEPQDLELQPTGAAEFIMADINNTVSNKNVPFYLTHVIAHLTLY